MSSGAQLVTRSKPGKGSVAPVDFPYQPSLELTFRGHRAPITSASFHPNATQLLTSSHDGTVMLWSMKPTQRALRFVACSGSSAATLPSSARRRGTVGRSVFDSCFSGHGNIFASGSSDGCVRLWIPNVKGDHSVLKAHSSGCVRSVALSHSTSSAAASQPFGGPLQLLTGGDDKSAKIWDVETQRFVMSFNGHQNWVRTVAFGPAHTHLAASGGDDKLVQVWDIRSRRTITSSSASKSKTASTTSALNFLDHFDTVASVDFHPDGNCIASGSADGSINLWDLRMGGALLQHYKSAHQPGGGRWSTQTGVEFHGSGAVSSVRFSPNGSWLLSSGYDGEVKLWDLVEGFLYCTVSAHEGPVLSARFSPTGGQFITCGCDSTVMVWRSGIPQFTPAPAYAGNSGDHPSACEVIDSIHTKTAASVELRLSKGKVLPSAAVPTVEGENGLSSSQDAKKRQQKNTNRAVRFAAADEQPRPSAEGASMSQEPKVSSDASERVGAAMGATEGNVPSTGPSGGNVPDSMDRIEAHTTIIDEQEKVLVADPLSGETCVVTSVSETVDEISESVEYHHESVAARPTPEVVSEKSSAVFSLLSEYVNRMGDVEERMSRLESAVSSFQANAKAQTDLLQQLIKTQQSLASKDNSE